MASRTGYDVGTAPASPPLGAPAPRRSGEFPRPRHEEVATPSVAGEIGALTGLRFVAAAWVVAHHLSFVPVDTFAALLAPLAPLAAAGPLGVDLFFVLSGLVLTRAYLERWSGRPRPRQVLDFLRARIARVWPLYAVVTVTVGVWCSARALLGGDAVVAWQTEQPGLGPASWARQLTMTQVWAGPEVQGTSFSLPLWSVSAEWLAYLLFPLLALGAWALRRAPRPLLTVLAVLAAAPAGAAALGAAVGVGPVLWPWLLRVLGEVVAGMLTWLVVRHVPLTAAVSRRARWVVLGVAAETLLLATWAGVAPAGAALPTAGRLALAVPMFPVLLGALVLCDPARPGPARWLAGPRMRHAGRLSYALYLVHFPLLEVFVVAQTRFAALAPGSSLAALLLPHVVVGSLVLAHLAHRFIEVPARRLLAPAGAGLRRAGAGRSAAARGAAPT